MIFGQFISVALVRVNSHTERLKWMWAERCDSEHISVAQSSYLCIVSHEHDAIFVVCRCCCSLPFYLRHIFCVLRREWWTSLSGAVFSLQMHSSHSMLAFCVDEMVNEHARASTTHTQTLGRSMATMNCSKGTRHAINARAQPKPIMFWSDWRTRWLQKRQRHGIDEICLI